MNCKICKIKIQDVQYVGLGKYEEVCVECAKEIVISNLPQMRENFKSENEWTNAETHKNDKFIVTSSKHGMLTEIDATDIINNIYGGDVEAFKKALKDMYLK